MTEGLLQFMKIYIPQIIGTGIAAGLFLSAVSNLLGYVISKVQGLIVQ